MTHQSPATASTLTQPIASRSPPSHRHGRGWTLAVPLALSLAVPTGAQAGLFNYSFAYGMISGTLGGVAFDGASFSITATGDSAGVIAGNAGGTMPYYLQPVTTTIALWGFSTVTFTNPDFGPLSLDITQRDGGYAAYDLLFGNIAGSEAYGFGLIYMDGTYPTLTQPLSISSPADVSIGYAFPTTGGDLIVSQLSLTPATYTIAVPVPGTLTLTLLGGLGLAARRRAKAGGGAARCAAPRCAAPASPVRSSRPWSVVSG